MGINLLNNKFFNEFIKVRRLEKLTPFRYENGGVRISEVKDIILVEIDKLLADAAS